MSKQPESIDYSQCRGMCSFVNECLIDHELKEQTDPVFFKPENLDRLEKRRIELNCAVFSAPKKTAS